LSVGYKPKRVTVKDNIEGEKFSDAGRYICSTECDQKNAKKIENNYVPMMS